MKDTGIKNPTSAKNAKNVKIDLRNVGRKYILILYTNMLVSVILCDKFWV